MGTPKSNAGPGSGPGRLDVVDWLRGAAVVLIPLTVDTARSLLHGDVGVDAIALVAIAGALILGEQLAGAIVALMMSGGAALEAWAAGRARRELRLLVERAPRIAHRHGGEGVEEVPVEELLPGGGTLAERHERWEASIRVPADRLEWAAAAVIEEARVRTRALADLPDGGVSRLLSDSVAGFLQYPQDFLGKSTVFAAFASHGVIPVCSWTTNGSRPVDHLWNPLRDPLPDGQGVADAARRWYRDHSLARHAELYARILQ